ncbi:MAG: GNAT family N-acetyltransferase [Planctomycetes bacterium]|nr:GNAT family N-acetyltransferase [Planctomycetota bacterium]
MPTLSIAVIHNRPLLAPGHPEAAAERGVMDSVSAFADVLCAAGHSVRTISVGDDLRDLEALRAGPLPDAVFNLCESFAGLAEGEPWVASWLEAAGLGYTGSTPECLALARHKARTKLLLRGAGLPTPDFFWIRPGAALPEREIAEALRAGALIVKPAGEDASLGLEQKSVVTDLQALRRQVDSVAERFGEVLIERFVPGREFNAAIVELDEARVLPLAEIVFDRRDLSKWAIVSYDAKWDPESAECRDTPPRCPAEVDASLARRMEDLALRAFAACGCRDYARIDLRVDTAGEPWILEVNANPDLGPDAGFDRALEVAGIRFQDFAVRLAQAAAGRARGRRAPAAPLRLKPRSAGPPAELRGLRRDDLEPLVEILARTKVFRDDEVDVGREVLEEEIRDGVKSGYVTIVAEREGRPVGFSTHGLVPLTDATYDLYWIAVDPALQGSGLGRFLIARAERMVSEAGGRWLLAETSGSPMYAATRAFYLACGYTLVGCVPDAYRPGDPRLTFGKRLDG